MPLSSIAQLIIRLYALKICVGAISSMAGFIALPTPYGLMSGNIAISFLPYLFVALSGIALWQLSPCLSKMLTKGDHGEFALSSVTREDLYTTTLLGLGVYFILESLASSFSWIHYFIIYRRNIGGFHMDHEPSYYDLTDNLLTLLAGIALALTCRIWARRLAKKSVKNEAVSPSVYSSASDSDKLAD